MVRVVAMTVVRMGAAATSSARNAEYFNGKERKVKSQVGLGRFEDGWLVREVRGKEENGEKRRQAGRLLGERLVHLLTKARAYLGWEQ